LKRFGQRIYDSWTNAVSGMVGLVSPGRALAYRSGRLRYRAYAAASKTGPNGYWRPKTKSGDAELRKGFQIIISRCRELAQNNPFIKGAIRKIVNNAVRNGIHPQMNLKDDNGKINKARNDAIEQEWKRWQHRETADVSGHDSIAGIQQIALRHVWIDGEFLLMRAYDRKAKKGDLPLRIRLLESDHLDSSQDGIASNGNIVKRGIEMDPATGRPLFYHITKDHPGDYYYRSRYDTLRIPATDIIHIYERERASMTRGVSWMVAIAMEAYDFADYQSYERIGAKLAAAFGVFVKSQFPEVFGGNGTALGGPAVNHKDGYGSDVKELPDFIEPGRIQMLPYGTDITIASHKRPGDSYEPYVRTSLRGQSVGTGLSYEAYSNDYSEASYSSARSATLEERLSYKGMQFFLNEQLNGPLMAWFLEALYIKNKLPKYKGNEFLYNSAVTWQEPGWGWVDPMKDANAAEKEINLHLNNRHNLSAQRGIDWDTNMDQIERELDRIYVVEKKKAKILALEDAGGSNA
jgi:lambda family phage portal protein